MLLGGLWHGAAWSYVLWGFAHGLLLVTHKQFADFAKARPRLDALLQTTIGTGFRVLLTFFCVAMCWVLFQPDLSKSLAMYERMFVAHAGQPPLLHNRSLWYTALFVLACHVLVTRGWWQQVHAALPAPVLGLGYAVCVCLAMLLAPASSTTFIYFQF
jgi:D-alanyl-lipoteichoic acid acyltransferase DltB (MBOAT superfamily)